MKVQNVDLSKTLKRYSNVWLALDPKSMKVVSLSKEPKTALDQAYKKGVDSPILTRVPKDYGTYIL